MNRLEKLKLTLAREVANQLACPALRSMYPLTSRGIMCDLFEDLYKTGWEKSSAEYEKIIAELENALESAESAIAVFTVTAYGKYNPNDWSLVEVKKALQKLKEFRVGNETRK